MNEISFYDKQIQFQEKLGQIQQQRSKLEREFHTIVRSDKRMQNLRTSKLRSYWKQICDREEKARERNEELLKDFANLEAKYEALHSKTIKLRQMKKEYEEEISKQYPKWRQEVDFARAKRQLENRGIDIKSASYTTPTQQPATTIQPLLVQHGTNIQTPLYQLVPVGGNSAVSQPTGIQDSRPHQHATKVVSQVSTPSSEEQSNFTGTGSLQRKEFAVDVPPLDLPSSAERDKSPTPSVEPQTAIPANTKPKLQSYPTSSELERLGVKSPPTDPTPMSPTHSHDAVPQVHKVKVEQTSNIPTKTDVSQEGNILDLLSEVSTDESDSFSDGDFIPDDSLPETSPPKKLVASKKDSVMSAASSVVSSASHSSPNKIVVPVPDVKDESQHDVVEAISTDSITTETSPRTDAPLTSSAAYQALIKSHDRNLSSTFGASGFLEDQDDLEEVLSPKGRDDRESSEDEEESETDSVVNANPVVHIPTGLQHSESNMSTQAKPAAKQEVANKKHKAPWDTDSEEESFDSRHQVAGGAQLDDDDFDFYD